VTSAGRVYLFERPDRAAEMDDLLTVLARLKQASADGNI
jgi:hypothetical protein